MEVFVHYGDTIFRPERMPDIQGKRRETLYIERYKPLGFWGCPKYADYTWEDLCLDADFHTDRLNRKFEFTIAENAKILRVQSIDDCKSYLKSAPEFGRLTNLSKGKFLILDTEKIYGSFDAMQVMMTPELHSNLIFNQWDVDSICVWNPDVIVPTI